MRTLLILVVGLAPVPVLAQTSFPMITHATPTALQRGTTAEVEVSGQMDFRGGYKVLIDGSGVTAVVVPPKEEPKTPTRSAIIRFTATPDAPLGVREFRLASRLGISSLGQLLIVDDPVIKEAGPTSRLKPHSVPIPAVICGRIEAAENVDYYSISAKGEQRLTLEVFGARIQDKIHDLQKHVDPLVRIFDDSGRELAASDDDFFADPVLSFRVPKTGNYLVEIRDAKYDGDPRWVYALAITDRPYITHAFPIAMNPGTTVGVEVVGPDPTPRTAFSCVAPTIPGLHAVPLQLPTTRSNPVPVVVTPLALTQEQEPNESTSQATPLPVPGGVNGRIQARRDLDYYRFRAVKGDAIRLEVFARRFGTLLRSRVDAVLDVISPEGRILLSNDDTNGKDPLINFIPPADGEYLVRVRDLNNKGGDGFAYYLEADRARPDFTLKVDPSKAMIGPGSRTAWYVQVTRQNGFTGPVTVSVSGLPAGVSVNPLTIPTAMSQGCLVLSAAEDAPIDASRVEVHGTAEVAGQPVTRSATPIEEIYLPGGGRGRFDVGLPAVAVTGPSDIRTVAVSTNRVVLKPGQEVTLTVTVTRRSDYDKTATLDVQLRHLNQVFASPLPPGVTMVDGKSKTLLGSGTTGTIVLKAAPDASACADVPICVQAYVPVNFVVKLGYSSEPILVTVQK